MKTCPRAVHSHVVPVREKRAAKWCRPLEGECFDLYCVPLVQWAFNGETCRAMRAAEPGAFYQ